MSRPGFSSRIVLILTVSAALASVTAGFALGGSRADPPATAAELEKGKKLYRKYCGQCHALREARAVGFGSEKGLGSDGGPSFNNLRVPYYLSVLLVTQRSAGHEKLARKLKWHEVKKVSAFVARATRDHPILALPIDG
jgi:mono/diheme cytochrome c family protein